MELPLVNYLIADDGEPTFADNVPVNIPFQLSFTYKSRAPPLDCGKAAVRLATLIEIETNGLDVKITHDGETTFVATTVDTYNKQEFTSDMQYKLTKLDGLVMKVCGRKFALTNVTVDYPPLPGADIHDAADHYDNIVVARVTDSEMWIAKPATNDRESVAFEYKKTLKDAVDENIVVRGAAIDAALLDKNFDGIVSTFTRVEHVFKFNLNTPPIASKTFAANYVGEMCYDCHFYYERTSFPKSPCDYTVKNGGERCIHCIGCQSAFCYTEGLSTCCE